MPFRDKKRQSAGTGVGQDIGQVFFELQQIGTQVKVCAIHAGTGIEVSIIAPTSVSQHHMQQSALAKLRRRLSQEAG